MTAVRLDVPQLRRFPIAERCLRRRTVPHPVAIAACLLSLLCAVGQLPGAGAAACHPKDKGCRQERSRLIHACSEANVPGRDCYAGRLQAYKEKHPFNGTEVEANATATAETAGAGAQTLEPSTPFLGAAEAHVDLTTPAEVATDQAAEATVEADTHSPAESAELAVEGGSSETAAQIAEQNAAQAVPEQADAGEPAAGTTVAAGAAQSPDASAEPGDGDISETAAQTSEQNAELALSEQAAETPVDADAHSTDEPGGADSPGAREILETAEQVPEGQDAADMDMATPSEVQGNETSGAPPPPAPEAKAKVRVQTPAQKAAADAAACRDGKLTGRACFAAKMLEHKLNSAATNKKAMAANRAARAAAMNVTDPQEASEGNATLANATQIQIPAFQNSEEEMRAEEMRAEEIRLVEVDAQPRVDELSKVQNDTDPDASITSMLKFDDPGPAKDTAPPRPPKPPGKPRAPLPMDVCEHNDKGCEATKKALKTACRKNGQKLQACWEEKLAEYKRVHPFGAKPPPPPAQPSPPPGPPTLPPASARESAPPPPTRDDALTTLARLLDGKEESASGDATTAAAAAATTTTSEAPPATRNLALVLRGHDYPARDYTNPDDLHYLRACAMSQKENVVESLQAAGWKVDVFLSLFDSNATAELLQTHKPVGFMFPKSCPCTPPEDAGAPNPCVATCPPYLVAEGLTMAQGRQQMLDEMADMQAKEAAGGAGATRRLAQAEGAGRAPYYAYVMVLRFDVRVKGPVTRLPGLAALLGSNRTAAAAGDAKYFALFQAGRVVSEGSALKYFITRAESRVVDTFAMFTGDRLETMAACFGQQTDGKLTSARLDAAMGECDPEARLATIIPGVYDELAAALPNPFYAPRADPDSHCDRFPEDFAWVAATGSYCCAGEAWDCRTPHDVVWSERELTVQQLKAATALVRGTDSHLPCASDDANSDGACGRRGFRVGKKAGYLDDGCCHVLDIRGGKGTPPKQPGPDGGEPQKAVAGGRRRLGRRLSRI